MRKFLYAIFCLALGFLLGMVLGMFMDSHGLTDLIVKNKATFVALGGLLVTSAVKVLPPPGVPFDLYTFLFDWSHQFLNITNTRQTPVPIVTPPNSALVSQSAPPNPPARMW